MASLKLSRSTAVSSASVTIEDADHTFANGQKLEIKAVNAGVWIHSTGGTAAASGDGCFHLSQNESIEYDLDDGEGNLTAIREGATDAIVVVSYLEK